MEHRHAPGMPCTGVAHPVPFGENGVADMLDRCRDRDGRILGKQVLQCLLVAPVLADRTSLRIDRRVSVHGSGVRSYYRLAHKA